jgi:myosin heavy subunit
MILHEEIEERLTGVEAALAQFIVQTNKSFYILQKEMKEFKDEMKEFKDEMKEFKDEMKEFKDEMKEFKDEMKEFKDEMKDFKDEMKDFKDEMKDFKDEMKDFKDEMKDFKDEMKDFKDESRQNIRNMNKQWGDLANKMGTLIEDIVMPAVKPLILRYYEEEVNDFYIKRRVFHKSEGIRGEFDVVAVTDTRVFLFEVKSTPSKNYINEFLNEQIPNFQRLTPEYAHLKLVPVMASLRFDPQVLQYASEKGVFAMAYREWDYMDLLNFEEAHTPPKKKR